MRRVVALAAVVAMAASSCSDERVDAEAALRRGLAHHQAGNLEAAIESYVMVLEAEPGNKYALYNLGLIAQMRSEEASAERYYRAAIDEDPGFEPPIFNLAILRSQAGGTQEAIDLYRQAIVLAPDHAEAHFNLGILLHRVGEEKQAQEELAMAIELNPQLAERLIQDPIPPSPGPSEP